MKKALIITYYFPPCHGSAPWRPYSWAMHFKKSGILPTVITRHWSGNEHSWSDYINDIEQPLDYRRHEAYEIYSLPSSKRKIYRFFREGNIFKKALRPFVFMALQLAGVFNIEVDAYFSFRNFIEKHLKHHPYDFILITLPPLNIAKLIPVIKKFSDAKIVVDFRDIWDNSLTNTKYQPSFKKRFYNRINTFYLSKWLKGIHLITTATPSFINLLRPVSTAKCYVIFNGYEPEYFESLEKRHNRRFRFLLIGSLYAAQDISILKVGLSLFLKDKSPNEVEIMFVGTEAYEGLQKQMYEIADQAFFTFSKRVNKQRAVELTVNSEVLFYPAWKGYKGIIGVKPLDYIASGNKILLAPGDDDILDALIHDTYSGEVANSAESFLEVMNNWFNEWKTTGSIKTNSNQKAIEFYSRNTQAKELAETLLKL